MSQYWQCPNCGAILKKQVPAEKIAKFIEQGREITGNASCGECGATYAKAEVYHGYYDVAVDPHATGGGHGDAHPVGEGEGFSDFDDFEPPAYAQGDDHFDSAGYTTIPSDSPSAEDSVLFEAPPAAPAAHAGAPATDAYGFPLDEDDGGFDLMADLNQDVQVNAAPGGTMVDYVYDTIRGEHDPYQLPAEGFDEFRPTLTEGVHCDVCARHLDQPEGYLLTSDEITGSEDFLDLVMERWLLNGWLPDIEFTDEIREQVRADLRHQGGEEPWLVCEDCILLFPAIRGDGLTETAREARDWWPADGIRPDHAPRVGLGVEAGAAGLAAGGGMLADTGANLYSDDASYADEGAYAGDEFDEEYADDGGYPEGAYAEDEAGYDQGYADPGAGGYAESPYGGQPAAESPYGTESPADSPYDDAGYEDDEDAGEFLDQFGASAGVTDEDDDPTMQTLAGGENLIARTAFDHGASAADDEMAEFDDLGAEVEVEEDDGDLEHLDENDLVGDEEEGAEYDDLDDMMLGQGGGHAHAAAPPDAGDDGDDGDELDLLGDDDLDEGEAFDLDDDLDLE